MGAAACAHPLLLNLNVLLVLSLCDPCTLDTVDPSVHLVGQHLLLDLHESLFFPLGLQLAAPETSLLLGTSVGSVVN